MKVVLYRDDSGLSAEAAAFLHKLEIQFEEVDVRTEIGHTRLLKRTQQQFVPAFELKRSHSVGIITGLNKELLMREFGR